MYTLRRTKLQFKIISKEDPVPIASAQQYIMSILFKYLYIFSYEKVHGDCTAHQNTPNCTIDKTSEKYAPIPQNIVCAVIHYLLFLYKK